MAFADKKKKDAPARTPNSGAGQARPVRDGVARFIEAESAGKGVVQLSNGEKITVVLDEALLKAAETNDKVNTFDTYKKLAKKNPFIVINLKNLERQDDGTYKARRLYVTTKNTDDMVIEDAPLLLRTVRNRKTGKPFTQAMVFFERDHNILVNGGTVAVPGAKLVTNGDELKAAIEAMFISDVAKISDSGVMIRSVGDGEERPVIFTRFLGGDTVEGKWVRRDGAARAAEIAEEFASDIGDEVEAGKKVEVVLFIQPQIGKDNLEKQIAPQFESGSLKTELALIEAAKTDKSVKVPPRDFSVARTVFASTDRGHVYGATRCNVTLRKYEDDDRPAMLSLIDQSHSRWPYPVAMGAIATANLMPKFKPNSKDDVAKLESEEEATTSAAVDAGVDTNVTIDVGALDTLEDDGMDDEIEAGLAAAAGYQAS